ncbi:glutamate--tRNA ligase family protein [Rubellicoccus peritrichatus]|uniref:Glutamate--tRNA ligase family protein n=1 Tax=Rubellicoccus peritrichatus TaxID=3080537 RepID=A0AAQ3QW81_9BACT|nr:glutamate--tRNA ligase family protein [Puniceicoccus sp. CR14]WOO41640.1 glutamate--tRNA ligase family protein [Puniceicoccus sp. CR14]
MTSTNYRGRIAPTPTGRLHLGHAQTFKTVYERCQRENGTLIYRDEDLDPQRCKQEFSEMALEDLRWLGIDWQEGPDVGGENGPYQQSKRMQHYLLAWEMLRNAGVIYPDTHSRKDLREVAAAHESWESVSAPHEEDEAREPLFPKQWRPPYGTGLDALEPGEVNWRFRVNDSETVAFFDMALGLTRFVADKDFGDFLIWRRDGVPSYELAVVVDDIAMSITEVVRGEDLLKSTARQLLIYRALEATPPAFYHCPLVRDAQGKRLAKRHDALSIRSLREAGKKPEEVQMLNQI